MTRIRFAPALCGLIVGAALCSAPSVFAQDAATLPVASNLTAEGISALPASLPAEVGRYTDFRTAGLADWHPTKREILISTRFANTPQVHEVRFPGGARKQLTFFPEGVSGATYSPIRDDFFLFSMDVGGSEFNQTYRFDKKTGRATLLTDGKSQNSGPVWSTSGKQIAYTSTRRNGRDRDIYIQDPLDPKTDRLIAELNGSWSVSDWSPDDKTLIIGNYVSANDSSLWLLDIETGKKTRLSPEPGKNETASWGGALFSPDGKGAYTTSDVGSEFRRLVYLPLDGKPARVLSGDMNWDVENFDLSKDGKTIVFVTNEDGASVLHLRDTASNKDKKTPRLPFGVLGGLSFRPDGKEIAFSLASARSASDVYSFAVGSDKLERWTESETGGLDTSTFAEPELVRWKGKDGLPLSGFLYRPDPAKFPGKRPVLISIHGGPESQSRPGFIGRSNYYLNELGIAVLYPNIRGSSGYGKTFLRRDNGTEREGAYTDMETLFDWIGTQPTLNAERVMISGGSYGGHMVLALSYRYPERIACALSSVGISHYVTFLERTEAYRRDQRRAEYGDERDPVIRAYFEKTAPLNNANKIKKPLFIVQGKNDPRVPYTEAVQMKESLQKTGTPVWFLMADDEGHGFSKKNNSDFLFYATVQFMREYLLK